METTSNITAGSSEAMPGIIHVIPQEHRPFFSRTPSTGAPSMASTCFGFTSSASRASAIVRA